MGLPLAKNERATRTTLAVPEGVPLEPKSHLLSSSLDLWAAGLGSILVLALSFLLIEKSASTNSLGWTAYYLGFVINWPHFVMSYQLLYANTRKSFRKPQFLWAAFLCPLLLAGSFVWIMSQGSAQWMEWMIRLMFLSVGWHYAKQSFGISLVFCHFKKYRLSTGFKRALKASLIGTWLLNWSISNKALHAHDFYGFTYTQLGISPVIGYTFYAFLALSVLAVIYYGLRHYFKTGMTPPKAAVITWVAMILWYLPVLYHPAFFLFVAFFHSLQYILFVSAYRKEKVLHEELLRASSQDESFAVSSEKEQAPPQERLRQRVFFRHLSFYALSIGLGYVIFLGLPNLLDGAFPQNQFSQGAFFLASFTLFINIHHYFVDNVIWRKGFGDMQTYLTRTPRIGSSSSEIQLTRTS